MKKKCAIIQPNFIPWIGYFEIINSVDQFILLDDVQYTRRDWRNRNLINNCGLPLYVTIPVLSKGKFNEKINAIKINPNDWENKNLKKIYHCYSKTKYFDLIFPLIKIFFNFKNNNEYLVNILDFSIKKICSQLKINTPILNSSQIKLANDLDKNEKIICLCKEVGCDEYISGASAFYYLNNKKFIENNIKLSIAGYKDQINYVDDKNFNFIKKLSIIDLLFHQGNFSSNFLQKIELLNYEQYKEENKL